MSSVTGTTTPQGNTALKVQQYQNRLQQARHEASQAQEMVRTLENEVAQARGNAARAENSLRNVERQAPHGQEPLQPSMINTQGQIIGRVLSTVA